jgi:hypothetical protein
MRDIEQKDTRHFEMRTDRDGKKMIPMRVFKNGDDDRNNPHSPPPTESWPMSSVTALPPMRHHTHTPSQTSERPLFVGAQSDREPAPRSPPTPGSVRAARIKAQEQMSLSRRHGLGMNPPSLGNLHEGLGSGSKLESPSDTDDASIDGDEKVPWNTIMTSSSSRTRDPSDSDETLQLPRMGSRDFGAERKAGTKGKGIGYAV